MISSILGEQRWWTDLGSGRTFNRVRIVWETAHTARYRINFSNDGSSWNCFCGTTYARGSSGWADHTLITVTYRYVGVQMLTRASRINNYSFFEFEAYNPIRMGGEMDEPASAPGDAATIAPALELLPENQTRSGFTGMAAPLAHRKRGGLFPNEASCA